MMDRTELQGKIKALNTEISGIFSAADEAKQSLTAEQLEVVLAKGKELDDINAQIEQGDRSEQARLAHANRQAALAKPANGVKPEANPIGGVKTDVEGRVTGYFEDTDEKVTLQFGDDKQAQRRQSYTEQKAQNRRLLKSSGYKPWGEFKSLTEFIRDGLNGHQTFPFQDRARKHFAAVQGMSEGVGSDGGYTVMPEFASGIIDRVYGNDLWGRTDNYSLSGNNMTFLANAETSRANGSRHGGMRGYWLSEGGAITSSKPTLREVTLKLCKLGVIVYLTQELIDDGGYALQQYVSRKAAEEFSFMIGDSLLNGTGVGQPLGILASPSLISVAKESGQLAATLAVENITKMFARFYAPNLSGALWLRNQDVFPQLGTMSLGIGAAGVTVYMPPGGVSGAPYDTLMGRQTMTTEFNPTLGTQGDLILADLGQILSISKGGVAQAMSMHVQFLTDQLALRFVLRLNAGPWESSPITPYKGTANTQSSFVTLDARA
ncbi:MAG: phage major capsid protein [Planctomycetaceae bacterium]|nr:phage major capsid protein [Planctomycetaceae bacterium]